MTHALFSPFTIAGISHHTASVADMEAVRFPDEEAFLERAGEWFKGVILLQTCNRIEVMVHGNADLLVTFLEGEGRTGWQIWKDAEALSHLLDLAAGLDSMVIGEDQILGQLRKALTLSEEKSVADPLITLCINKAIHAGSEARRMSGINRGAVSIGSAAVLLAEERLGSLEGRHILVLGSGEMGVLVTQALAAKHLSAIYVANRTFDRARLLAEKVHGTAVPMADLYRYLTLSDVVICCTAAPHPVIRAEEVSQAMNSRSWPLDTTRRPLIIVDIAQPRDVEEEVGKIPGICLYTIDDLRKVNDDTAQFRKEAAMKVRAFLDQELTQFIRLFNRKAADELLATLHSWAEQIRIRERDRALSRLSGYDDRLREVTDDLTRVLTRKLLTDVTLTIRTCAERGEMQIAENLVGAITRGEMICSRTSD
ncbi:glutamyl-tRNA reductase [Methanospirillum sp.]|uniref:glutamyl-tRNA reductase n=2 Tax=Methanospirillum sp. TaxID=45200 RepID=UPI002D0982B8|nr:glutamyl-tRNA reductase [Methanospirillum sp.]HOL41689.1 glutamyl-tRNA reductase [Methanospirillum sp.]HPP78782.1 glutamyl-tRNA reductase [Methanospirillum sp.]